MKLRDEPIVYLTRLTWKYSDKKTALLYILLFCGANIAAFIEPLLLAMIFNTIQEQGLANIGYILFLLAIFFLADLVFWIFHGPARVIERKNAFKVQARYKDYLVRGTMNLPIAWHTDHHSGDTFDKIEKGTTALDEFASDTYLIIESSFRLVGSYFALVYFNLHASYLVLLLVALTLWMIISFDRRLIPQYKKLHKMENTISAKVFDAISNITTIIILRVEKLVASSIYKKVMKPFQLFSKNARINEFKWFCVSMASSFMVFIVLASYIVSEHLVGGVVLLGTLYALYEYVRRISAVFFRFAYKYGQIVRQKTLVENAELLSNEFKEKERRSRGLYHWKQIDIKNLVFSYHDKKKDLHLDNINISFRSGEKVALIGESGSGKTTFLKVLRELYPAEGEFYVDKKKLKSMGDISEDIALIPQDPEIFNTTIKENITLGISHSVNELKKYTDMARITKVIEDLPNAWNSTIVEKGVNLSGGQKQRLALARGLLASEHKHIILLDESTSSVDPENEHAIYENIFTKFADKTIIASIHKMHLLPMFDTIYQFSNGKITASGTFKELMKKPKFKKQWEKATKGK